MPQTREHVVIAELLGVRRAVVALTKTDLVEDEWLELARADVDEFLSGTVFAGAPAVATSAVTGQGIDELRDRIGDAIAATRRRTDDLFRLPVDRAFSVKGTGTVITGTVWSGRLERDQRAVLLPGGTEGRVRGLQVHGQDRDAVEAGERAAIALAGVDRDQVDRGMTLVTDSAWHETLMLTARLRVLSPAGWSLEPWQRVRVHIGTAEVMARAVLLDDAEVLAPGDEGWVQLRLEAPLVARAGDRFVLRSYSPVTTIGGGSIAEPVAPKRSRLDHPVRRRLAVVVREPGEAAARALLEAAGGAGVALDTLPVLSGATPGQLGPVRETAIEVGDRLFHPDAVTAWSHRLRDTIDRYHARHPLEAGMEIERLRREGEGAAPTLIEHVVETLVRDGTAVMRRERIARADWSPTLTPEEEALRERIADVLADAGIAAPSIDELTAQLDSPPAVPQLLALLEDEGRVVRIEHDRYVDAAAVDAVVAAVRDHFAGREGLGPADFREVVDVTRKHLMPLLGYLDREGVTARDATGRSVPRP
jgi:selenocysteine-specific elongation factor